MHVPHGTIVVIVDGAHFALMRNSGTESEPVLEAQAVPALDLHGHASGGQHGHMSGHDPASQVIEAQHGAAVVQWLNAEVLAHRIHDLVIIASPRALGELRPHYHGQLTAVLRGELAKDMVGRSGTEVLAALRA
ncbi:host attachment protein [Novosphingobium sp.]|uniref:baeRF12 domain-containing protein n=1 Tax=Novosphingobium sp. TaxID=1874826 RepID=UPI002624A4E5|nr:host attachment protein [Novosphingobium sp.]